MNESCPFTALKNILNQEEEKVKLEIAEKEKEICELKKKMKILSNNMECIKQDSEQRLILSELLNGKVLVECNGDLNFKVISGCDINEFIDDHVQIEDIYITAVRSCWMHGKYDYSDTTDIQYDSTKSKAVQVACNEFDRLIEEDLLPDPNEFESYNEMSINREHNGDWDSRTVHPKSFI